MNHARASEHPVPDPAAPPPPPPREPAITLIAAGLVPILISAAAAATSIWGQDPVVARTAWICTAVVGTATMISAAVSIRPRPCGPPPANRPSEKGAGADQHDA